jgi:hypothetical protein
MALFMLRTLFTINTASAEQNDEFEQVDVVLEFRWLLLHRRSLTDDHAQRVSLPAPDDALTPETVS